MEQQSNIREVNAVSTSLVSRASEKKFHCCVNVYVKDHFIK
jgi:hypothetical protein